MNRQFYMMMCRRMKFLTVYGSGGLLSTIFNLHHQLVALDLLLTTTALPYTDIRIGRRLAPI